MTAPTEPPTQEELKDLVSMMWADKRVTSGSSSSSLKAMKAYKKELGINLRKVIEILEFINRHDMMLGQMSFQELVI